MEKKFNKKDWEKGGKFNYLDTPLELNKTQKKDNLVWSISCVCMLLGILGLVLYEYSNKVYDPIDEVSQYCKEKGFTRVGYDAFRDINFICFNNEIDKLEVDIRSNEFRDWNRTRYK